ARRLGAGAETGAGGGARRGHQLHTRRGRVISRGKNIRRRAGALLMAGTVLGGSAAPLFAQTTAPAAAQPAASQPAAAQPAPTQPPAPPTAPAQQTIRSIAVRGNQRLEAETI